MLSHEPHLLLSATDLANHLACRHLTALDRAVAEGRTQPPAWRDPALDLLRERGLAHERAYVEHLRAEGLDVVGLRELEGDDAVERTAAAMREGAGVIVQAALQDGRWHGRADVLLRVEAPSALGPWSYEVADTKLALETRGGTVLQLCLYTDLLRAAQGREPERMHVVKPGLGFPTDSFRFADFHAYYRVVRRRLEAAVEESDAGTTYPEPVAHCEVCRWWPECDRRRRRDDHLCLVAGIGALHIEELRRQGIDTLEALGDAPDPLKERPARGSLEAFARIHGQARIQLRGRREERPVYEFLPPEEGRGLALLPEPSPGDLFFDIESDPFVGEGGLEYLLGVACRNGTDGLGYRALWAFERAGERAALEAFIDLVMARWEADPGMHVYHFSPYEPAAIKRLMSRHATREAEVDRLLRAKRFVDLLAVTRQGVRASIESYSLKDLERFSGFRRDVELRQAGQALRRIACALELGSPREIRAEDRDAVEGYNRDDCLSTAALRDWLEERRAELESTAGALPRPEAETGEASEAIEERAAAVQEIFDRLTENLPEAPEDWDEAHRARWLLAHELEYFRREDRGAWWEFFRLRELEPEDLLEERKAIAGLELVGTVGGTARCPIERYRFPAQEMAFRPSDRLHEVGGNAVGTVDSIDLTKRTLDIKKRGDAAATRPAAVVVLDHVRPQPVDTSLLELGRSVAEHGVDGGGPYRAARDLLLKARPRLAPAAAGGRSLRDTGEDVVCAGIRLARSLDLGVLPIQGPPGTGKTYTGGRMIAALATEGYRVGVTALSHEVIRKLLGEALAAARQCGSPIEAVHKVTNLGEGAVDGLEEVTDNGAAQAALAEGKVVGGTAWLWARDDMVETIDYLFVDEAGQLSLAHTLGAARCARNLVLLGDPQQLVQPQRAAHPEGAEVAALVHLLDGRQTLPDERGLFLDVTWRLHPDICAFTSELYYEGRLRSRPGLERQALTGDTPFAGSGLFFVPVTHRGNTSSAPEEVEAVGRIVEHLLGAGVAWIDADGTAHPLDETCILVVAPYNAQVSALAARLPTGVRVGTIDRFQGQEAPVVIYSATSSSAEDAPRGMAFLYDPHRLNVATSRARCGCILVASPRLMEAECRTPEQMRWANGLCRYRELAREVGADPGALHAARPVSRS